MKKFLIFAIIILFSCCAEVESPFDNFEPNKKTNFDIVVTREGKVITRSELYSYSDNRETELNEKSSFGIIAIDKETNNLVINNQEVFKNGEGWNTTFGFSNYYDNKGLYFSGYYPYSTNIDYLNNNESYIIPFSLENSEDVPLVTRVVERKMGYLDYIPLEFRHVTNTIGFKISDVTADPDLRNLITVKKIVMHNIAMEGYYVNNITQDRGLWKQQSYYCDVVYFEGSDKIEFEHDKYVGKTKLVDKKSESCIIYTIPDDIELKKQYVEVFFDVDEFELSGTKYKKLENQKQVYQFYGVLPNNKMDYGKQYTFHLGIDLGFIYQEIQFTASVADWTNTSVSNWENKIYEDNNDF